MQPPSTRLLRGLGTTAIAMLLLVAAACAPTGGWTKPGASEEEMRRDAQACEREAKESGHGLQYAVRFLYEECMRAKGYQLGAR